MTVEHFDRALFRRIPEAHLKTMYENPHIRLPFDAKDLAVYLHETGEMPMRALDYHHRSADLGLTGPIEDTDNGHVYFQVDVKGVGFLFPESYESVKHHIPKGEWRGAKGPQLLIDSKETPWEYDVYGLMDKRMAKDAIDRSEALTKIGVRTEAVAAVYETDAIYVESETVTIKEIKDRMEKQWQEKIAGARTPEEKARYQKMRRNFREQFTPVILTRLVRSVFRLRDIVDEPARREAMLDEACDVLNREMTLLGQPASFETRTPQGREQWMEHTAGLQGKNLGLMHANNFVHGYLHMGNLTLAGEIVDLDSVTPLIREKKTVADEDRDLPFFHETEKGCAFLDPKTLGYQRPDPAFGLPMLLIKDMRDLCFSIRQSIRNLTTLKPADRARVAARMADAYEQALQGREPYAAIGIANSALVNAFRSMADTIVTRDKHVGPIPQDRSE